MEFVEGISIDKIDEMKKMGINPEKISHLLNDCFNKQIFDLGVVHADPHSGNIFVSKKNGKETLILLDHGVYKYLTPDSKLGYAKLWKGIFNQDETLIKEGAQLSGVKKKGIYYRMFASMLTTKTWEEIMDGSGQTIKERLGVSFDLQSKKDTQEKSKIWMKEINECLLDVNQDLLLVLKVNEYLKSLNYKLGQPTDTFYYMVNLSRINIIG